MRLPHGQEVLLSDTVGFIAKLPTTVVAAFRATLEELDEADLLLHVVDLTDPHAAEQNEIVHDVLDAIEKSAKTGRIGDGKIFIMSVDEAVRIRTGERGKEAI